MRQPQIELYVEFENIEVDGIQNDLDIEDDRVIVYEGMNSDNEEDFETTYEADDDDEDGDVGVEAAAENVVVHPAVSQPMNIPPFMRNLDLDAMNAPEFLEYANIGVTDPEDEEFKIGMECSSRKSVVTAIRSYTIFRGFDYNVYESEPQTFYAKYSDTVAEAIRPLVETDPSIKVKSIISEVQSRNLQRHVVQKDGVDMISDRHESIRAVVNCSGGDWQPSRAWWMFCIRHIDSNFLRAFKVLHLQKLVVNIGYSRTVEEYNINYKRLEERGEAYAQWCDAIGLRHWVLAFDDGHRWGHITTNLVDCINSVLTGARNLPVLALVRATYYWINELFMRKSVETHEHKRARFTYSVFAQQQIEANMQRVGNIVVHRFDRQNEIFEVREMPNRRCW
ncbi:hypothetical protein Ahy_A01g000811 [Arachis hypogaea]|uniref:Uncharacterized protein n=1 Tax=Arachis hypogaea TaxID=3818 RepID=A0A445EL79_ARAHY|nr:hypothetical protein Ahy_A01g000811 [Arachis hypogaea]